jgi:hypothetical protein
MIKNTEEIISTKAEIFIDSALINPSSKNTWFEKPKLRIKIEKINKTHLLILSVKITRLSKIQLNEEITL